MRTTLKHTDPARKSNEEVVLQRKGDEEASSEGISTAAMLCKARGDEEASEEGISTAAMLRKARGDEEASEEGISTAAMLRKARGDEELSSEGLSMLPPRRKARGDEEASEEGISTAAMLRKAKGKGSEGIAKAAKQPCLLDGNEATQIVDPAKSTSHADHGDGEAVYKLVKPIAAALPRS